MEFGMKNFANLPRRKSMFTGSSSYKHEICSPSDSSTALDLYGQ
jgi:hypothetical protein